MYARARLAAVCALVAALLVPAGAAADGLAAVRRKLAAQARGLPASSGAYVRDLATGRTLYARRAGIARVPASNEKLLVTATMLMRYASAARLHTTLVSSAEPADGVIGGDVALVGVGDPYLTTARLRTIAGQLRALGVEEISGRVLGDGTFFDGRRGSYDSAWAYDSELGGSLGGLVADSGRGRDPAVYAAQRLRQALLAADIVVRGAARAGSLGTDALPLAGISSDPVSTLIARVNLASDNFAAEMLLKHLGGAFGGSGSTPAGAEVVRETLSAVGVSARPYDGSGLSRADQVSPRELVDLLTQMAGNPALRASLPVAGRSGTLAHRMHGTPASGRCSAKTGTLRGVSALSGYCTTAGGREVAFSFVENAMSSEAAKRAEDRMVALLAGYGDPPGPSSSSRPASSSTATPRRSAFSSLAPGESPATT